ncbi:uncharacterized protein SETTUDRAFT_110831, partial [Exserohilum turcica Et28A]
QGDRQVKRLSQVLHSSSFQNSLDEVRKPREALVNERTRRKRGKPLPLQEAEEYHGGAVFWSPRKVKEARDRLQLQEEEEQLQLQKADTRRQREEARQARAREKEQRRQARLAVSLMRQKEREEKAVEKASRIAARRAAKQLQKAIKTSQRGRRRSFKASAKATQKKKRPIAMPQGGEELQGGAAGSPPPTSRRGRAIRTPSRFL